MSLFKFPQALIDDIHRMCTRFWWNNVGSSRKIYWCSWDHLCASKNVAVKCKIQEKIVVVKYEQSKNKYQTWVELRTRSLYLRGFTALPKVVQSAFSPVVPRIKQSRITSISKFFILKKTEI
ncbi:hypothetical protein ACOSQ3_024273 [Xanthoceras sorbifolium]